MTNNKKPAFNRDEKSKPLPIGFMVGHHPITEVLSTGGFSYVYLSRDKYNNPVAIKEYIPPRMSIREKNWAVAPKTDDKMALFFHGMKCFFEEGRALVKINHKNVVKVIDFIRENDTVYIVMKYEAGKTLHEYIKKQGEDVKEKAILKFFIEVCDGLAEVHRQKILHLDLKPANIYLRKDGSPILLDFGSVRHSNIEALKSMPPTLTHGFAAPEQYARGSEIGPWTDIYSVGASMYACIIGEGGKATLPSGKERIMGAKHKSAESIGKFKYSNRLLEIIDWCLEVDWKRRPRSADELKRALMSVDSPITNVNNVTKTMNKLYRMIP